ncbi:hypothetical protein ACFQZQ_11110 [Lysobacter koreensis]|uniref:Isochorismatase family protein n=1 Tax=Lysobacter koreensis TaxID=266122 RepID=A0ABW2YP48_9GAMM
MDDLVQSVRIGVILDYCIGATIGVEVRRGMPVGLARLARLQTILIAADRAHADGIAGIGRYCDSIAAGYGHAVLREACCNLAGRRACSAAAERCRSKERG